MEIERVKKFNWGKKLRNSGKKAKVWTKEIGNTKVKMMLLDV